MVKPRECRDAEAQPERELPSGELAQGIGHAVQGPGASGRPTATVGLPHLWGFGLLLQSHRKNSFLVLSFGLLPLLVSEDKGLIQAPLRDAARSRVHSCSC